MMQLRFTRRCGAVSFATQVSVSTAVSFSVHIQVETLTSSTKHSLLLKEAIQNALQDRRVAQCSSYLSFPTTPTSSHASAHTAITEISMQISFHTQHVSAARKIISDVLLLMLERFGICLLQLCIRRDGERQAFVENVPTTAHNKKQQGGGGGSCDD
jgi:hypothetical protein